MDEKVEAFRAKLVELEALQHPLDQVHLAVETEVFFLGKVNHRAVIEGTKANRTLRLWHQRRVDVARDRGVEHTAAARFGIRRDVGAAPPKTKTQWRSGPPHPYLTEEILRFCSHDSGIASQSPIHIALYPPYLWE